MIGSGRLRRMAMAAGAAVCAAAALSAATATAGVVATTTIGANSPLLTGAYCFVTLPVGDGLVFHDPSYTAPAPGGHVTSFAYQNDGQNGGAQLDFVVLRQVRSGGYMIVGRTGLVTLGSDSLLDTVSPAAPILVAPGDQIGFFLRSQSDTASTSLNECFLSSPAGTTQGAARGDFGQPGIGDLVSDVGSFAAHLNLSAQLDQSVPPDVYGGGLTSAATSNAFAITALSGGSGQLAYTDGADRTFDGVIDCVDVVGNAATIVAHDPATGLEDRTQIQDNGASGDKLINLLWDPTKTTARANQRNEACTAPNTAKLAHHAALAGDAIHIG
jgi:hypothetical protein